MSETWRTGKEEKYMNDLYYKAPTDDQFNELKEKVIAIWSTYDDTYGYASEKIGITKRMENIGDNFMSMVAMFDPNNQLILSGKLSESTRRAVAERIKSGGAPDELNMFL